MNLPSFRTVLMWTGIVIVVLWVFKNPAQAGGLVNSIGSGLTRAANSASVFISSIGGGSK